LRRTPADPKRGISAAVADVENRRQRVADALQQLQQRERRVQDAELCVGASYMFFAGVLQVLTAAARAGRRLFHPRCCDARGRSCLCGLKTGMRCRGQWRTR
jgi:hypothetical protein